MQSRGGVVILRRAMRLPRILITALAVAAALPAAAHADTASFDGATVTIRGSDQRENVILSVAGDGSLSVNSDEAGPGCVRNDGLGEVRCPMAPVRVETYGGDDRVSNLELSEGFVARSIVARGSTR